MSEPMIIGRGTLYVGDMREVLPTLPAESVDSCVCDPPYHLTSIVKRFGGENAAPAKVGKTGAFARASRGFMGQTWDGGDVAFQPETWREVYRVLKPGAHLVAFGGSRTFGRVQHAIELAGFEIRDSILEMLASDAPVATFLGSLDADQQEAFLRCVEESTFGGLLAWVFGSGFPKSHDVSKGIDKAAGREREVVGLQAYTTPKMEAGQGVSGLKWAGGFADSTDKARVPVAITAPATPEAAAWEGWGTALKPAFEPIILARKPLGEKTVAANVLRHGTGALNIDGCRIESDEALGRQNHVTSKFIDSANGSREAHDRSVWIDNSTGKGRWPANVVLDGSEEVADALAAFGERSGAGGASRKSALGRMNDDAWKPQEQPCNRFADQGTAARFFYSAKAGAEDRFDSDHPTVKPLDLMRWLCRLITPPGGAVLDPFAGSGTTGEAALREGFSPVLVELTEKFAHDCRRRLGRLAGADCPLFAVAAE